MQQALGAGKLVPASATLGFPLARVLTVDEMIAKIEVTA
jgi:hypothetical protein